MDPPSPPQRPATPLVMTHRLPDLPDATHSAPSKHIVLIAGGTDVGGKVAIARDVAAALACPLYQGDSLHESAAKAASVGGVDGTNNEARYRRMWLSKMTRTGLLFPDESRPSTEGFSGFGGASASTSRRGSASSVASAAPSSVSTSTSSAVGSMLGSKHGSDYHHLVSAPVPSSGAAAGFTMSEVERRRRANPALMVLTHPQLAPWHKLAIRSAVGDYGLGVIFVPLYREPDEDEGEGGDMDDEEEELPVLRPLDPTTMTRFPVSFGGVAAFSAGKAGLGSEVKISIDVDADVEGRTAEIVERARALMGIDE
ncbi:hypothetical protein B0T24DRAFT_632748 [Lasiosphaeria ovina]|uniref:Uncharacterized protein n=1 Tax=Lasiosphaeria ovina TaxID=92902 RepID=A0AAE0K554_9PEZI|nr:hypothetical protein B0T24DRAFT_632748 [Lasiosphaeria ovina]